MRWAWLDVVGVRSRDAREHVLIAFARQQVAIVESGLAEIGQQRIAARIRNDLLDHLERTQGLGLAAMDLAHAVDPCISRSCLSSACPLFSSVLTELAAGPNHKPWRVPVEPYRYI